MKAGDSVYKCKYCGGTIEAKAGQRIGCANCNVKMDEVKKGVANKAVKDAPVKKDVKKDDVKVKVTTEKKG